MITIEGNSKTPSTLAKVVDYYISRLVYFKGELDKLDPIDKENIGLYVEEELDGLQHLAEWIEKMDDRAKIGFLDLINPSLLALSESSEVKASSFLHRKMNS